jgi:hypothetical protein
MRWTAGCAGSSACKRTAAGIASPRGTSISPTSSRRRCRR